MAPEQAADANLLDGRSDIYSLGGTLYFLLTGQPPYADGNLAQKLLSHQMAPVPSVREVRPEIPEAIDEIIAGMMAKDPDERYQTPHDVAEALAPWTQQEWSAPPPAPADLPERGPTESARTDGPVSVSHHTPGPASAVLLRQLGKMFAGRAALKKPIPPPNPLSRLWVSFNPLQKGLAIALAACSALLVVMLIALAVKLLSAPKPAPAPGPAAAVAATVPLQAETPKAIAPEQADQFVNKLVAVEMAVRSTGYNGDQKLCFLNSLPNYRDAGNLTVVIGSDVADRVVPDIPFADLGKHFQDKTVAVTGRVTLFSGRPQIVAREAGQVRVIR
jgi:DNA/RNA endonuclease YhcR with UshA esterase domain